MAEQERQPSVEESETLAVQITMINQYLHLIDHDYVKLMIQHMRNQAGRQEGLAVLLPTYPQKGNEILYKSAKALDLLEQYVDTLKEVDALKKELEHDKAQRKQIENLFAWY